MRLVWLNYGPPGSGKSYLAWTASKCGWRVLHLDLFNEADVPAYPPGSKVIRIIDEAEGNAAKAFGVFGDYVRTILEQKASFAYDLIVVDSLDTLQYFGRDPAIADEMARSSSGRIDEEVLSPAGYGRVYVKMINLLLGLLATDTNIYCTALPGFKQDPSMPKMRDPKTQDLQFTQIRPDLFGKLALNVERFFSLVTYQTHNPERGENHRLYIEGGERKTKDRYSAKLIEEGKEGLREYYDDPTWEEVVVGGLGIVLPKKVKSKKE